MKQITGHLIHRIEPGSIAEEMELKPGDRLISINGQVPEDILDYHFMSQEEYLEAEVETASGEALILEIEKDVEEDLGIIFENALLSEYRSCSNRCIFCFIDQMPPGMRDTLYFKDDDARLSFLQGNYVTLTNMKEKDIGRIIRYRMSPINISVHTTNQELRCMMLHNRFAGEVLKQIERLYEGEILMNGQIVLCRGVNDGEKLEETIADLSQYLPWMQSVSVVPAGLSRFREGLYPLRPFTKEEAGAVIDSIEAWQKKLFPVHGLHFVHASDEFYLLAGRNLPEAARYDGYLQLENGVGMMRMLLDEVEEVTGRLDSDDRKHELSLATGRLAYPWMCEIAGRLQEKFPFVTVHIYEIVNHFFGEMITVSGLITGADLQKQLSGKNLGEVLLLPLNMFRSGEEVFLDDVSRADLESALQVPVDIVKSSGQDLVNALLRMEVDEGGKSQGKDLSPYELKEQV